MTAFDNIKVNNWPATSNDLEDFLVLKMPLNDNASLTESLPVVAGSKELFPKRTLTNTATTSLETGIVYSTDGTQTGNDWGAGHEITGAFRKGFLLYTASGEGAFAAGNTSLRYTFPSPITVNTNVKIYFWRNGGKIKVKAGETDEQTDSTSSGYTTWTIPASDVGVLRNVELYTDGNTGPYWSGIEVDGVQLYDAPGGSKKHYDNNANFNGSTTQLTVPAHPSLNLAGDFTIEAWTYQDAAVTLGTIMGTGGYYSGSNGGNWVLRRSSATQIAFASYDGQGNSEYVELSASTSLNTWHHIALVRSGTSVQIYVDGVAGGSMTVTKGLEDGANNGLLIGNAASNARWNGKFQDIRIYNGVATYTANFTPPGAILG